MPLNATKIDEIKNDPQALTTAKATIETVLEGVADNHKAAAVADLAGGADLATTVAKVNELLAALRTAGLLAT